jgi:chondroitin AC lyase
LPRLERIARAAYQKGGRPDAATLERIVTSLRFWLAADPRNVNWWHNEIGVPRAVGVILTILGDDAPDDVRAKGVALMRRANWARQTGANLLDETWIQVMRGCVERDPAVVDEAFVRTWQELRIVGPGEEGIMPDGGFHQHGPLLYNQSYGGVLLGAALKFFAATEGTAYRAPDSAFDALATFTLDGNRWMRRGDVWDWSACGRAITRPGATRDGFASMLAALAGRATGPRAETIRSVAKLAADDPSPFGNKYFWRSDFLAHRRPGFHASVRMYSTRTANTDILTNGENKLSHHIADGATCVMIDGREYLDIYPVWDWERIPGTTAEQGGPMPVNKIRRFGASDVAGGVSDGDVGCAAMDLVFDALRAKKAWFCFDDAIVCLGTDVRDEGTREVVTTLNQCLLDGPVYVDGQEAAPGDATRRAARWAWHAGIGYASLDASAGFDVRAGPQRGAWSRIGVGPDAPIERGVFLASWSHGAAPAGGTYAYAILPGATRERTASAADGVRIVANTGALQAVVRDGVLQAIFRAPGEASLGDARVRVDRPCALMLRTDRDGHRLSVASLTNASGAVRVELATGANRREVDIDLPGGPDAGTTVGLRFDAAMHLLPTIP